jgi:glycosyltransferase involved in cell wall biosynthesis
MPRANGLPKLAIVTDIMAPYRIPLLNAIAEKLGNRLTVFFMGDRTDNRLWSPVVAQAHFEYVVVPGRDFSRGEGLGFNQFWNPGMFAALGRFDPDVIVVGGYHHPTSYVALAFAKVRRKKLVLWSESTSLDIRPSSGVRSAVKQWFIRQCAAFIVPGVASEKYLLSLGVERGMIHRSPNSIDVDGFEKRSLLYRTAAARRAFRDEHGLPERLLLFVGRMSPEKGFPLLLETAARLQARRTDVGVVVLGEGPRRDEYLEASRSLAPGSVLFRGFVQQEELSFYYAQADVLMVPSLSEPWGFVVNEALACGLPVVCSRNVGAGYDMITDGETGYMCGGVDEYVSAIESLLAHPDRERIAANAAARSRQFNPEAAADGFVGLVEGLADVGALRPSTSLA